MPLVLPSAEVDVSPGNVLFLLVRAEGRVDVRRGRSPELRTVAASEIADVWRREAAANPRLIAAVEVEPDAAYGRMIGVLDQLQGAGARRISLRTLTR